MIKRIRSLAVAAGLSAALAGAGASSAGAATGVTPPAQDWSFSGIFGTYDRAQVQRGFQVYKEVCAACHSLRLIAFRNLKDIGYSEDQVKALAEEYEITDGPNDEGEFFPRPGTPADRFPNPFPNEKAAAAANGGAVPPDLSLVAKSRGKGGDSLFRASLKNPTGFPIGADYLYALLTGYTDPPEGVDAPPGGNYNTYYPGHWIKMAQPLYDDSVEYADGTKATLDQLARDVSVFMQWAAEPELEERKRLGVKVVLFLLVLTGMLYAVKRSIWRDVH